MTSSNDILHSKVCYVIDYLLDKYKLYIKLFFKIKNDTKKTFYKENNNNKKKKLCFYILNELPKFYPFFDIIKPENNNDDIIISNINIAFSFDNVYDKTDLKIRKSISSKISTYKSNDIKIYIFDIDDLKSTRKSILKNCLNEINLKINKHIIHCECITNTCK